MVIGQRRLAIIDLSPSGAQPMQSADRRYVITFNGEIYNYRDIRRELDTGARPSVEPTNTIVCCVRVKSKPISRISRTISG